MAKDEVLETLERIGGRATVKELVIETGSSRQVVHFNLASLKRDGVVERSPGRAPTGQLRYLWRLKKDRSKED